MNLTRQHIHEEVLPASPARVFALLHTPSEIRSWWSAARVIVIPKVGGTWTATWGSDEDAPDYIAVATIRAFEPPHRLTLEYDQYHSKSGGIPFQADFVTEFSIRPHPDGAVLKVVQDGFPLDTIADAFYAACETGWRNTFAGIRRHLERT